MVGSTGTAENKPHLRIVSADTQARVEEDDAELVARVRAKEPAAAGRMWDRYAFLVRRLLRRMLGPVDVEDCVQDAFLRLFRDLRSLRDPSALRSFLIGIAVHVAHSELRKRRAKRWLLLSSDGAPLDSEAVTTDDWHEPRAAVLRLYQILDRVSDKHRTVFVLRYIEGLELSELATLLGCSLAKVKRRVADASTRVCTLAATDPLLAPYLEARS
jgi:RNA polymerase sigma-70 factor (ECF subfamily)